MEEIYTHGRFQDEDKYEIMKVRQVIRNHIFKRVNFCMGKGIKSTNNFEKKGIKICKFS